MNWYLVVTKPHKEQLAETTLRNLSIETFFPLFKKPKTNFKKEQSLLEPLFPGYLFVRFDFEIQFRAVNFARGVRSVVTFGGVSPPVDDSIIESIQARIKNGFLAEDPELPKPGQVVKISRGPFNGIDAIFERGMSDQHRVMVLLQTVSYQLRLIMNAGDVVNL